MKVLNRGYVTTLSVSLNQTHSVLAPLLFSSTRHSLLSSSTSAAECSRPCCAWLSFQASVSQGRELGVLPLLPAVQFSWVWQTAVGPVPGRLLDQR